MKRAEDLSKGDDTRERGQRQKISAFRRGRAIAEQNVHVAWLTLARNDDG
jgi:hypothetical protein